MICNIAGKCPVCGAQGRDLEPHAADCPPGDADAISQGLCGWEVTETIVPPWGGSLDVCAEHATAIRAGRDLG